MRKSEELFLNDQSTIKTESFRELCRTTPNVLIRRRKMPTEDLVYSMINRKGLTLKLELRNYMKITHPGTEISKPGYLKQRMKLNPEAIKFLYQNHNKNFYSDPEITPYLYKDHLVFAKHPDLHSNQHRAFSECDTPCCRQSARPYAFQQKQLVLFSNQF